MTADNYTYDANNRLTQAGTTTYTYDANGNLTATSTGRTFTWDVFNRLTQATGPGGTVTHTYDGDGLKLQRVGPDGTRRYYYDGIRPLWEADGAGVMTAQYDRDIFGNLLSRREASGARRYYHFDGLGSTTALTNESGAATSTLLYDAWGNQRAATGSDQGRYRFTGAELDAATGLYHMGARFYDPAIGRWLSEDPVQDRHFEPIALNFYAYARNDPTVYTDPTGAVEWINPPADQRIQDEIDARRRLGEWLEDLYITGRALVVAGISFSLTDLLTIVKDPRPAVGWAPTFDEIVHYYAYAAAAFRTGALVALIAGGQTTYGLATLNLLMLASAVPTTSLALATVGAGFYYASIAMERDRRLHGGRAFGALSSRDQRTIGIFFGR
jgi:RHS repeat-associated protein